MTPFIPAVYHECSENDLKRHRPIETRVEKDEKCESGANQPRRPAPNVLVNRQNDVRQVEDEREELRIVLYGSIGT